MLLELFVRFQGAMGNVRDRLLRREEGATAAEYALLVALIAVAIIAGARFLGSAINTKLSQVGQTVSNP